MAARSPEEQDRVKKIFDQINTDYPVYSHERGAIPYDLDAKLIADVAYLRPSDIADTDCAVLTDTTSLLDSGLIIANADFGVTFDNDIWETPQENSGREAALQLLAAVALYDVLLVDGFVLSNSPRARKVAAYFPGVIKPLFTSHQERISLHNAVAGSIRQFWTRIGEPTESLLDMDAWERGLFEGWFRRHKPVEVAQSAASSLQPHQTIDFALGDELRASTSWQYRILYYIQLSALTGVPYLPHPGRILKLASAWAQDSIPQRVLAYFENALAGPIAESQAHLLPGHGAAVRLPPVAALLKERVGKGANLVEAAQDVRATTAAKAFRCWCGDLRSAIATSNLESGSTKAVKMWRDLETACEVWLKDLDEGVRYKSRKLSVGLGHSWGRIGIDLSTLRDPVLAHLRPSGLLFLNDLARAETRNRFLIEQNRRHGERLSAEIAESLRTNRPRKPPDSTPYPTF